MRIDFYTLFHKALRRQLFEVAIRAGATDFTDADALARFAPGFARLASTLRDHAAHEDRFMHPLLQAHLPEAFEALEAEHAAHEGALVALEAMLEEARATPSASAGLDFYRALQRFIAQTLAHLDHEETHVMPRLWECCNEALLPMMMAFSASFTPEGILENFALMAPALTPTERAALLEKHKAAAGPAHHQTLERLLREVGDGARAAAAV